MKNWKTIKESEYRLVWACTDDDCGCDNEAHTDGNWHEINGTPICEEGRDMEYIRMEVADSGDMELDDYAIVEIEQN